MSTPLVLSPAQLETLSDQLADKVADRLANRRQLVDRYELAQRIGLSVPTIDRRRKDGVIPFMQTGNRILFDVDAVIVALSGGGGCNA